MSEKSSSTYPKVPDISYGVDEDGTKLLIRKYDREVIGKSRRSLSSPKSPDVCYDTDEDGTKLIIRKFDMPLPKYNLGVTDTLIDPLPERKIEKWKYQHDVPEGKIFTKRVHADVGPGLVPVTPRIGQISPVVPTTKVSPTNWQNIQLVKAPLHDVIFMAPKDQTPKLLSPVLNSVIGEKTTVSNLPSSVGTQSVKVVDSRFVNGKKMVYLKALDDKIIGKIVSKKVNLKPAELANLLTGSQESMMGKYPSEIDGRHERQQVYIPPMKLRNITDMRQSDIQGVVPISQIQSSLIQKMNITPVHIKPINTATVQTNVLCQKGESLVSIPLSSNASGTIPITNIQVSALTSQNNREIKNSNVCVSESLSRIIPAKLACQSVISDVPSKSGLKTLQVNTASKSDRHILIEANKQNINLSDSNISVVGVELLNSSSENTSSVSESVLRITDQHTLKENKLTFVPADSTTPFIVNSSVNKNDNKPSSDAVIVVNPEGISKNLPETIINVNQKSNSNYCADPIISTNKQRKNSLQNMVIINQTPNSTGSRTVLPTSSVKYDELMRRRKIALKFQQDIQRHRDTPKIERIMDLPPRKVKVVDGSTQTSLFCLLEPGRMVEMFVNDDSNDLNSPKQVGSREANTDSTSQSTSNDSSSETDPPLSKRIRLDLNNDNSHISKQISDICQNTLNENPYLTSMEIEDIVPTPLDNTEKENMGASNNTKTSSKNYKVIERDIQNININNNNNSMPLASITSSMNSPRNINERMRVGANGQLNSQDKLAILHSNKKTWLTILNDYRGCLVEDEDGNLPIHNAVMDKDISSVERQCLVLIAQKQSVDVTNRMKETPLHLAVLCHELNIVKLLLRYKARPDIPDSEGNTAMHMAIKWGNNADILRALLENIDDYSPALNMPNDEGYSPLHLCALHNKAFEAFLLVQKHADVDIKDRKSGRTPLFHAVENSNTELSRMLVDSGASTTIANFSGQTPLNASEVTFVLDKLTSTPEQSESPREQVAPCSCQTEAESGEGSCHSGSYADMIANASIEILVPDNDISTFNLLDRVFHNR